MSSREIKYRSQADPETAVFEFDRVKCFQLAVAKSCTDKSKGLMPSARDAIFHDLFSMYSVSCRQAYCRHSPWWDMLLSVGQVLLCVYVERTLTYVLMDLSRKMSQRSQGPSLGLEEWRRHHLLNYPLPVCPPTLMWCRGVTVVFFFNLFWKTIPTNRTQW